MLQENFNEFENGTLTQIKDFNTVKRCVIWHWSKLEHFVLNSINQYNKQIEYKSYKNEKKECIDEIGFNLF